jgi:DNA-binding transcriptional LysR family regulator
MDSLTGLKVFRAVVDSGSFAAASKRLGLSRAAVSQHVNRLESRLRVRLIERTTRTLHLTEPGVCYHERCAHILDDLEQAERDIVHARAKPAGTLRVSAPHSFAIAHIAPYAAEFLGSYPDLKLDISLSDRVVDVIEEGFDLAICITVELPHSSLVARLLAPCRFVVCGAPSYFARHPEPAIPDDLVHHQGLIYRVTPGPGEWTFICPQGCPQGEQRIVKVGGRIATNSSDMLRTATLNGAGLAAMPTFLVGENLKAGRLRAVLTDYRLQSSSIFAVYPSRKYLSPKVRVFIDFLAAKFGPEPYWDDWLRALPATARNPCELAISPAP